MLKNQVHICSILLTSLYVAHFAHAAPSPASKLHVPKSEAKITQIDFDSKNLGGTYQTKGSVMHEKVILNADGTASRTVETTITEMYAHRETVTEQFTGKIAPLQLKRLVNLIETVKFSEFKDYYGSYDWNPAITVEIHRGTDKKSVLTSDGNRFGGANTPIGLWGLQMAIRGVASEIKWEKVASKSDAKLEPISNSPKTER